MEQKSFIKILLLIIIAGIVCFFVWGNQNQVGRYVIKNVEMRFKKYTADLTMVKTRTSKELVKIDTATGNVWRYEESERRGKTESYWEDIGTDPYFDFDFEGLE